MHPILIVAPAGLMPFSFVMDVMHYATKEQSYADAAYHSFAGGLVSALVAGAAGAVDYMSIPEESRTKRTANTHALLNIGVVAVQAVNYAMREKGTTPTPAAVALSGVGTIGLLLSSWFGGHMVYEQGMRVKGRSEIEDRPDLKIPGDDAIARTIQRLEA